MFDVLSIDELEDFKSALTYYGKNRLESFSDAIQSALDVLVSLDQASEEADLYDVLYTPYYEKLIACRLELDKRQKQVDELQLQLNKKENQRIAIQKELDFESFLGEKLYTQFSTYRRETVYSNDNYISDGLSNTEIIDNAKRFIEVAKKELIKSSEQQIAITSNLYNLLLISAFAPIVDKFETGNWIRIRVDGILYRLRLLGYEINFDDLKSLNVEFSNAHKNNDSTNEIQSIIESAKSMGQTYGYVAKQADKGSVAHENIQGWLQNGLNSGLVQIKNNDNEEVTYGKHGILCRSYDDILGDFEDKQLKLTHNTIAFTDNNWRNVKTVIGENTYMSYNPTKNKWEQLVGYGLTSQYVMSGVIYGENEIIGGMIRSKNYSDGKTLDKDGNLLAKGGSYIDLNTGEFSFAGDNLYYRYNDEKQDYEFVISNIKAESLHVDAGNVDGDFVAKTFIGGQIYSYDYQTDKNNPTTHIDLNNGSLKLGDKFLFKQGNLSLKGSIETDDLTAVGGSIGNWQINKYGLYNDKALMGFLADIGDTSMIYAGMTSEQALEAAEYGLDDYPPFMVTANGDLWCTKANIICQEEGVNALDISGDVSVWGEISVNGVKQHSKAEYKKNFEKLISGLDIINDIDIYKFNYKSESDEYKKHFGLVIGDDYNYSQYVTSQNNDSVDMYSLISVCVRAIQELHKENTELQTRLDNIEKTV